MQIQVAKKHVSANYPSKFEVNIRAVTLAIDAVCASHFPFYSCVFELSHDFSLPCVVLDAHSNLDLQIFEAYKNQQSYDSVVDFIFPI